MTPSEICRLYFIIRTFLRYGLDSSLSRRGYLAVPLRLWRIMLFWIPRNRHKDKQFGVRLRLALLELGPVWVKFGLMLSTRRDFFPPHITDELAMLLDRVAPFEGLLAKAQIKKEMGNIPLEIWLNDFDVTPLASASIALVHAAQLKENGKEVVIKIIRPDIVPIIKADMRLIHRLASWVPRFLLDGHLFRPTEVVLEYERLLFGELNLLRESANAIQLRRNFKNSSMLYVPEVYLNYCSLNMMVMERIYGIPISDVISLERLGTNMKLLSERGVLVFFTQVFRDGFFHADMHPGNIFVSHKHPEDPQYIGIDCGIMGSLNKQDKRYLAENFIAFFNRDYRKVAELHVDSGWVSPDTDMEEFEFAIRTVCEPIFKKLLSEISFGCVLFNFFNTARCFNMEVLPKLILLQKTLLYVEGIGKHLYPLLDLWETAKPFLDLWIEDLFSFPTLVRTLKNKIPLWVEKIPELPELMHDSLRKYKNIQNSVDEIVNLLKLARIRQRQYRYIFHIGAVLLLSGTLLLINYPNLDLVPIWLMTGGILIWIAGWKKMR